jgi:uridine kinase
VTPGAAEIVAAIRGWHTDAARPLVVAIDGYGASGKTTIAAEVADAMGAAVVATDDYLHDADPTADERPMAAYYDWQGLRQRSLEPTIESGVGLVLVEGVSSGSPALGDLVARSVFVDTPESVRLERLHQRITDEEWDDDWLRAERVYFAGRPPDSFDLIVPGA